MLSQIRSRLKRFYQIKIKKMDPMELKIAELRKKGIQIGEHCRIFSNISSTEPYLIRIGDNVSISSNVSFCTHDNAIIKVIPGKTDVVGPITIGNNCFIGMNSILMLGVTLDDNCIVGAGSVVTHSFPSSSVIAGNPARRICSAAEYADKYRDKAVNSKDSEGFKTRQAFYAAHPELLVKRN
ncbi:MAG: acyltransferase [Oscillospiraceae bacterium]|nr:acyltransferase [Oscillospiraceae bacterium]